MVQLTLPWPLAPIKFPIAEWLPVYDWKKQLSNDMTAALTVFVLMVPQGMAYALLAGVPPIYGLYSSIAPLLIYAVLGTSHHLSLGPMAITSLLLSVCVQNYGYDEQSEDYIKMTMNLSMVVGLAFIALGVFQLGALANLISESVLTGFLTASALVIVLNQVKYIIGISTPRFYYTYATIWYLLTHLDHTNANSTCLGVFTLFLLYGIRYWKIHNKPTPERNESTLFRALIIFSKIANCVCIVLGSVIAYGIRAGGSSLDIVGTVPSGLKAPSFESVGFRETVNLVPASLAIAFVAFAGNWAIAKKYAAEKKYKIDATQELIASGFATFLSAFFNSFAGSAGLARSAVNFESGAETQLAGILVALLVLFFVQFLTPLFFFIPMCVLAAIIIVSVLSMIDFEAMVSAYRTHRRDCLVMVATFLLTFFVGVSEGLFAGIFISITVILYTTAFPSVSHMGRLPEAEGGHFTDVKRFSKAEQIPGVAVVRMDSTLVFANCAHFKDIVLRAATGEFHTSDVPVRKIVIDASCWVDVDLSGVKTLFELKDELVDQRGLEIAIAGAKWKVWDRLRDCHFLMDGTQHYQYFSVSDAMNELARTPDAAQLRVRSAAEGVASEDEVIDIGNPLYCCVESPVRPFILSVDDGTLAEADSQTQHQVGSARDDAGAPEMDIELPVRPGRFSFMNRGGFSPLPPSDQPSSKVSPFGSGSADENV